jgi:hypothetical protein
MQSRIHNFAFDVNFNFATENLLTADNTFPSSGVTPVTGNFLLLDGTFFLLLDDSTNLLLL